MHPHSRAPAADGCAGPAAQGFHHHHHHHHHHLIIKTAAAVVMCRAGHVKPHATTNLPILSSKSPALCVSDPQCQTWGPFPQQTVKSNDQQLGLPSSSRMDG
eukprot:678006-Pelagomonas_calceolata.AAC.3